MDIADRLDPDLRDVTVAVRRRTSDDGSISFRVEFTMAVARVPRNIRLLGYSYPLTPVVPAPRRCFTCQRFRHISNQCRSSPPICEFCSEHHRADSCPNKLGSALCSNCCGDHAASSCECPMYQYEFEILLTLRVRSLVPPHRQWALALPEDHAVLDLSLTQPVFHTFS